MNPPRRGEIHLGELLTVLATLQPGDAATARAIAASLGFGLSAPDIATSTKESERIYDRGQQSARRQTRRLAEKKPPGLAAPPRSPAPVDLPAQKLRATLKAIDPQSPTALPEKPAWISSGYQRLDLRRTIPLPRANLFPARTVRGVFTAALSTPRAGEQLDVDALLRHLIEGCLPRALPRLPEETLARGCQLLLDFSDSMLPLWEDLRHLSQQFVDVLGRERVSVFEFDTLPGDAHCWPPERDDPVPWQPEPGRPVVVATGFGAPGRRVPRFAGDGWHDFVGRCARQGSPLNILIPWSPACWPSDLGPHARLVHWHERTSAAMLSRRTDRAGAWPR